ncbi:MAG TPA: CsbD family protein [Caulobacteraceae bacterium]|jgi:uncharacterized protein YjbJ (UPF0337 family)|nr:CsbD family protein [Caulobacteraceae bacterium]
MSKDTIKGTVQKARGSVKEAVGKAVGNDRLRAKGMADKAAGSARKAVGKAKDAIHKATR